MKQNCEILIIIINESESKIVFIKKNLHLFCFFSNLDLGSLFFNELFTYITKDLQIFASIHVILN